MMLKSSLRTSGEARILTMLEPASTTENPRRLDDASSSLDFAGEHIVQA